MIYVHKQVPPTTRQEDNVLVGPATDMFDRSNNVIAYLSQGHLGSRSLLMDDEYINSIWMLGQWTEQHMQMIYRSVHE
jgi:hypothetical protein